MFALIRKVALASLASTALMGLTLAAHADIVTYNFNAVFTGMTITSPGPYPNGPQFGQETATATGTVHFDNSSNVFTAADIFLTAFGATTEYASTTLSPAQYTSQSTVVGPYTYATLTVGKSSIQFSVLDSAITADGGNLVLSQAGGLPTTFSSGFGPPLSAISGSLSVPAVAATPEPSSLVLLGTGILGFAGAARRRFRTA